MTISRLLVLANLIMIVLAACVPYDTRPNNPGGSDVAPTETDLVAINREGNYTPGDDGAAWYCDWRGVENEERILLLVHIKNQGFNKADKSFVEVTTDDPAILSYTVPVPQIETGETVTVEVGPLRLTSVGGMNGTITVNTTNSVLETDSTNNKVKFACAF